MRERITRKGEKMANLVLEDLEGTVDVTVFQRVYQECRDVLSSPDPIFVVGRLKATDKGIEIHADEVFLMSNVRERLAKSVHFRLEMGRAGVRDVEELARGGPETPGGQEGVRPHREGGGIRGGRFAARFPRGLPLARPGAGAENPLRVRRPPPPLMPTGGLRMERAFLVYARRKRLRGPVAVLHVSEVMQELSDLVKSAGADVAASHVQTVDAENPATLVGKGTIGS